MQSIGQTISLWRIKKGLTQAVVSGRSGVSRPNLSAIEQGARDLTVQTLRRIASALGASPGALVDGIGPEPVQHERKMDRYSLDRIARLAAGESLPAAQGEKRIADDLASVMQFKIRTPFRKKTSNSVRSGHAAILRLKRELGPEVFRHLIRRIEKHLSHE